MANASTRVNLTPAELVEFKAPLFLETPSLTMQRINRNLMYNKRTSHVF